MFDNLIQPKGSTIGLLQDGRTVEEAILQLDTKGQLVSPKRWGTGGTDVDSQAAIQAAIDYAIANKLALDLRGARWECSGTVDFSGLSTIVCDQTGPLIFNPSNFTSKFTNKYAVTFGNPDVAYGAGRVGHVQILGSLNVASTSRAGQLHGVYFKGSWFAGNAVRATGFNGSAMVFEAVWDSVFNTVSGELSGNTTDYQIDVRGGGDTSNCLTFNRIQSERAYHKCLRLVAIRSVFNDIHAERTAITSLDDGSSLPDGTKYVSVLINVGNSDIHQIIHDAITGDAPDGTPTVGKASVQLNLDYSTIISPNFGSCFVNSTFGRNSVFASTVVGDWTIAEAVTDAVVIAPRVINNLNVAQALTVIGGTIAKVTHLFNCANVMMDNVAIAELAFPNNIRGNIRYRACRFPATMTLGDTKFPTGFGGTVVTESEIPVTFENCKLLGTYTGAFNSRALWIGGRISTVSLASRAATEFRDAVFGSFTYTGDRAFITNGCTATTVAAWGTPNQVAWPMGKETRRLGADTGAAGVAFRSAGGAVGDFVKIY